MTTLLSNATLIADAAVQAMVAEAVLTPKPGLVDLRGNSTHPDMSVGLLIDSARSLRDALRECVRAAEELPLGPDLRARVGVIGRAAEQEMLVVTGGVNTHRGALWALGLLAAGAAVSDSPAAAADFAGRLALLPDRGMPPRPPSHGERARVRFGAGGAVAEAGAGFPRVLDVGLPALRASRRRGASDDHAALDALLAIMADLDDTCVLHRGGPRGLRFVHRSAAGVLAVGGSASPAGQRALERFCGRARRRRLSMGGSADLLAATLFCDTLPWTNGDR